MGNALMVFEYKSDGTFTALFPDLPQDQGGGVTYNGAYLVSGNVMVTYLDIPGEGAAGYTFKVVDNNTINVTEVEVVEGELLPKDTTAFTRVAGSTVNKNDTPFELDHPYLGKWNYTGDIEGEHMGLTDYETVHIVTNYEVKSDGTLTYDFTVSAEDTVLMSDAAESPYLIFDNGNGTHTLVVYEAGEGFDTGTIAPDVDNSNTIYPDRRRRVSATAYPYY